MRSYLEVAALIQFYLGETRISRLQVEPIVAHSDALDREVAVDKTDGNAAVVGRDRTVNDEQVALVDAGIYHRIAYHPVFIPSHTASPALQVLSE